MTASQRTTAIALLLLVTCMTGSVILLRRVDTLRSQSTLEDVLYISSPKVLKRISLGYDGLLADIYWTRVVQYFGSRHYIGAKRYALLAPLLDITTVLDPHLTVAYEFGANFLGPRPPNGAGMTQEAINLVNFGIRNNPDDWRLYYELGFIYYMDLHDYAHAADAFARGSKVPDAHPFLKVLAALMAEHAGETRTAQILWTTTYETTKDKNIRANALAHLRALRVDQDVTALDELIARYKQMTGRLPANFVEMQRLGLLQGVPVDPLGQTYKLMPDGQVEVRDPDDLPFLEKGLPPGYVPPANPKFLPGD